MAPNIAIKIAKALLHSLLGGDVTHAGPSNFDGEREQLTPHVAVTHRFVEAAGVRWHFVSAGDPKREAILFVHGLPETWYAYHHQIAALAEDYFVVAIDMKGYGQSDTRLELDYRNETMARELAALLDTIGVETFNLVGHDRGSVLADHLLGVDGMQSRVLRYVRMQQSASEPHGSPKPPHALFASAIGERVFKSRAAPAMVYRSEYVTIALPDAELERLTHEWRYKGVAEAVRKYFKTTNFEIELADRRARLFACMTMPVLFLQGRHDPGQHPEEYQFVTDFVPTGRVEFIDAGHFMHLERPALVTRAMRRFLQETQPGVSIDRERSQHVSLN